MPGHRHPSPGSVGRSRLEPAAAAGARRIAAPPNPPVPVVVVVPWRVDDVPTTTAVPASMPLLISAIDEVTRPTSTDTCCGSPAEVEDADAVAARVEPTSAIDGTATTLGAEAVVIDTCADMPDAVPAGGVGMATTIA